MISMHPLFFYGALVLAATIGAFAVAICAANSIDRRSAE